LLCPSDNFSSLLITFKIRFLITISINRLKAKPTSSLRNYFFAIISKELSLYHKLKFCNLYILTTWWCKSLIFQTLVIWSNRINILKYLRYQRLSCKDIGIRKSEFVAKTQFLLLSLWCKYLIFQTKIIWTLRTNKFIARNMKLLGHRVD